MTLRLLISESLRRFTEQRPGPSRPPPPRHSDSPLGSTPRRNPVPLADRFQLRCPQDGGLQMALLAFTRRRDRPCVFNDAFVGTEVIWGHLFLDFLGDLLGRY
ncbi:unnamed protein product [Pleuronectes platessa]|uniref:Uncharacterized protein n=1 Tax=Pleuronectes platessa TaxID=8262 RepID=A0A9N7YTX5_PLEPL|nr:unnamed protein product [Pleuronectes platessa]